MNMNKISEKQHGFIKGLCKRKNHPYDGAVIEALTREEATRLIDDLKSMPDASVRADIKPVTKRPNNYETKINDIRLGLAIKLVLNWYIHNNKGIVMLNEPQRTRFKEEVTAVYGLMHDTENFIKGGA